MLNIKHIALVWLTHLLIGCGGNPNSSEERNELTKSLVNTYLKSIDSKRIIQISESSYGPINRDCLTEILNKYKFEIPTEETFQAQETDSIVWSKDLIDVESVKILNSQEFNSITKEVATSNEEEKLDKTFYVISKPIFSKNHDYAILKKYFYCGGRCGQGSVLIYKKRGNDWILREDVCAIVS
ncbi:hypothetical protein [Pedobacter antarcticus]|uniref:hypothetical protein n=1 Tax=Pedobacter antarcticus TaxID=34086 RepID=UPI00292F0D36|nr:hypothetical protein [Pedobacter antarcticus]